jgi:hypothetical protein
MAENETPHSGVLMTHGEAGCDAERIQQLQHQI